MARYFDIVWLDDLAGGQWKGRRAWMRADPVPGKTIAALAEELGAENCAARVFYEGPAIESHAIECPPLKSRRDVQEFVDHRIHAGMLPSPPGAEATMHGWTRLRQRGADMLRIDIADRAVIEEFRETLAMRKIDLDFFASLAPAIQAAARLVKKETRFALIAALEYDAPAPVIHMDGGMPASIRIAPPCHDEADLAMEIERNATLARQFFGGAEAPVFLLGVPPAGGDAASATHLGGRDAFLDALDHCPVSTPANMLPRHLRGRRSQQRRAALAIGMLGIGALLSGGAWLVAHEIAAKGVEIRATHARVSQQLAQANRELDRLRKDKAFADFVLSGEPDMAWRAIAAAATRKVDGDLILTQAKAAIAGDEVRLDLAGRVAPPPEFARIAIERYEQALRAAGMSVRAGWRKTWLQTIATWQQAGGKSRPIPFAIHGAFDAGS